MAETPLVEVNEGVNSSGALLVSWISMVFIVCLRVRLLYYVPPVVSLIFSMNASVDPLANSGQGCGTLNGSSPP